ncbi:hypothetical protein [Actinokineospora sp. NPDC004072]
MENLEQAGSAEAAASEVARATTNLLQALYFKLRHGHDQAAKLAQAAAARTLKQTKALQDLADVLDRVARHLGDR